MDRGELRSGIVPYSPIAHGFFGGRVTAEQVSAISYLVQMQSVDFCSNLFFLAT
jgi:hypothetical protein